MSDDTDDNQFNIHIYMEHEVDKQLATLREENRMLREEVSDLKADANKFPTLSEFSNLQDDYEKLKQYNEKLLHENVTLFNERNLAQ